jgi:hypothetical protein
MKFRTFLFRETSKIFAKQARLSYRFVFRETKKKQKLKTLVSIDLQSYPSLVAAFTE